MNTQQHVLAAVLASIRAPRLVTIRVRSDAEYRLLLLTLAPVWPTKGVQS